MELYMRPCQLIASEWNAEAPRWFKHDIMAHPQDLVKIKHNLTPYIFDLGPKASIVEFAAGANNSIYYPDGFDMNNITAVDISEEQLKLNPSGRKIRADIRYPLKLPRNSFDLVVCMLGMRYLENQEEVLWEMYKLLKVNSWAFIADYSQGDKRMVREFNVKELAHFLKSKGVNTLTQNLDRYEDYDLDLLAFQKMLSD